MNKIALIFLIASATLFGGGYKIPENSLNSIALSAAYVANAHGADATYYNPANMALSHANALKGVMQPYKEWTVMAGVAYDETPVAERSLNFELPDSDAWIASMGVRYAYDTHWSVGAAALVDGYETRAQN